MDLDTENEWRKIDNQEEYMSGYHRKRKREVDHEEVGGMKSWTPRVVQKIVYQQRTEMLLENIFPK